MTTGDVLSTPQKIPLPPSPPGSAHRTPGLGIDQTLSPYPDLLVTPSTGLADSTQTLDELASQPSSLLGTPSKRSTKQQLPPGQNGHRQGRKGVAILEDFELIRVIGKGCAGRVSSVQTRGSGCRS